MKSTQSALRKSSPSGGFSLIEILVAVLIMAILSAISIPIYISQKTKSQTAAIQNQLGDAARLLTLADEAGESLPSRITAATGWVVGGETRFKPSKTMKVSGTKGTLCVEGISENNDVWAWKAATGGFVNTDCTGNPNGLGTISVTYPALTEGSDSQTLEPDIIGATGPMTFTNTSALPAGVTLNATTGVLTGPPLAGWTSKAKQVSGGISNTCVVNTDKTVKCWGFNAYHQSTGTGDTSAALQNTSASPTVIAGVTNAEYVSAGSNHSCALITGGTVTCWGSNTSYGQMGMGNFTAYSAPAAVPGLTNVKTLSVKNYSTCVSLTDGTVKCWGYNYYGQLGSGDNNTKTSPTTVPGLSNVKQVSLGVALACALLNDGTIKCWGYNGYGGLGNNSTTDSLTPVTVSGISNAIQVSAGLYYACAVLIDGTAKCWGYNGYGGLGDGTYNQRNTPVDVSGLTGVSSITTGAYHTCARLSNNTAKCWGQNTYNQLGEGTYNNQTTPTLVTTATNITDISNGYQHTCATTTDGSVKCWGFDTYGQLGGGTSAEDYWSPVTATGTTGAVKVSAGYLSTCAIMGDASAKCWGYNVNGGLGIGTADNLYHTATTVPGVNNVTQVDTNGYFACALINDGTIKCWGHNYYGQLGDGTGTQRNSPITVPGITTATKIALGNIHMCALLADRTVKCWGYNGYGGLGDGTTTQRNSPTTVPGLTNVTDIAAGTYHTCATFTDGTVKCWGWNASGQIGDGSTTNRVSPTSVTGISTATKVAVGDRHSCATLSDGTAKCWGYNSYGGTGDGTVTSPRTTPVVVTGWTNSTKIDGGYLYTCGMTGTTAKCWGYNEYGQLGDGTVSTRTTPYANLVGTVTDIDAGQYHACAVVSAVVKCWGLNHSGQLGNGTKTTFEANNVAGFGSQPGYPATFSMTVNANGQNKGATVTINLN